MKRYFSPETKSFYIEGVGSIPADAVPVTLEQHIEMQSAKENGKIIQSDENGKPVAVEPPPEPEPEPPTYEELRQTAILEKWPMAAQLEALTEAAEDPARPEKMNQLLADVQEVKAKYPKPEGE
ncbi:hypothetical protein ACQ0P8_02170 [Halodesulfovibrio aestuarii]|uniref:Phage tail protein n=1 Tax=Halodesulfovibrio aestuarii TaxID=126333 RepID=A0A8G2F7Z7_9BACT|nr:hypothetical protein [Halodesulfovibrio aestuarii]SHI61444.1 hypothetical protein SAMN05660830_00460 [Halodesulfovibrio aestuarii]